MSSGHSEPQDIESPPVTGQVYLPALAVQLKPLAGGSLVSVGLPAALTAVAGALMADESHHIFQGIIQENSDFVGKQLSLEQIGR